MLQQRGPRIIAALVRKMNQLVFRLQAKIVNEKLAGQVLHHRTGTLASSIRAIPTQVEGAALVAKVEGGGGPAFYGKFHEFGTTDWYTIRPINKKALAFMMGGKQVIVRSVYHPPIKERSFMRSSLAEMREQIQTELQETITEAANG